MSSFNKKLSDVLHEDTIQDIEKTLDEIEASNVDRQTASKLLDQVDDRLVTVLRSNKGSMIDIRRVADRSRESRESMHVPVHDRQDRRIGGFGKLNNVSDLAGDMLGQLMDTD